MEIFSSSKKFMTYGINTEHSSFRVVRFRRCIYIEKSVALVFRKFNCDHFCRTDFFKMKIRQLPGRCVFFFSLLMDVFLEKPLYIKNYWFFFI